MTIDPGYKYPSMSPANNNLIIPARYRIIAMAIGLLILVSCGQGVLFDDTKRIHGDVWKMEDRIRFEVPVTDTLQGYKFYLNVRHTTDYRYSNLYVFITTVFPGGEFARDTVECILARPDGEWLGKGIAGMRDNQVLLRVGLKFPRKGIYSFEFEQAMREEELEGISDIGLRIEKE